jgi:hypothetical protein
VRTFTIQRVLLSYARIVVPGYRRVLTSVNRAAAVGAEQQLARPAAAPDRARLRALAQRDKETMAAYLRHRTAKADEQRKALRALEPRAGTLGNSNSRHSLRSCRRHPKTASTRQADGIRCRRLGIPEPVPQLDSFLRPPKLFLKSLLPGIVDRHQQAATAARKSYADAVAAYAEREADRERRLAERKKTYTQSCDRAALGRS